MRLVLTTLFFIFAFLEANAVEFKFADAEKAREILLSQDAYFNRMSPAEIAIRMSSVTADKTAEDLKAQYSENLLNWAPEDIAQVRLVIEENWASIERIAHLLPDTIYFIRGTDKIEGGLPHTQGNAIIFQISNGPLPADLFLHEVFHVLSRHNFDKHAEIYALLGFTACEMEEPDDIKSIHLTNPDVPVKTYYLPVDLAGEPGNIVPFLYAAHPAFNPEVEGGFGGHFGFGLLEVEVEEGTCTVVMGDDGKSTILGVPEVPGYLEAIGRNTGYIIHAEETTADNFVLMLLGGEEIPNPEIPARIGAWIDAQK